MAPSLIAKRVKHSACKRVTPKASISTAIKTEKFNRALPAYHLQAVNADVGSAKNHVRFGSKADMCGAAVGAKSTDFAQVNSQNRRLCSSRGQRLDKPRQARQAKTRNRN